MTRTLTSAVVAVIALALTETALPLAPATAHTAPAARAPVQDTATRLTVAARLTSSDSRVTSLPGGIVYGWNLLTGATTWGRRSASLELQGSVRYTDGSGPFTGLVTLTRSDGTVLALSLDGTAKRRTTKAGTKTRFTAAVEVIGGSGGLTGATGNGTMTGSRKDALGAPVDIVLTLNVVR